MIITLLASFVLFLGLIALLIFHAKKDYSLGWEMVTTILLIIGGVCLFIAGAAIALKEVKADYRIVKIDAIRETFATARGAGDIDALELIAIQHKIVEKNEWIANAKFWTEHPLTNWFWSKKILKIEPIK